MSTEGDELLMNNYVFLPIKCLNGFLFYFFIFFRIKMEKVWRVLFLCSFHFYPHFV